ncbi:hypothetical protein [uncultured Polaribacter sp.]|uniref:hypothetical protein n=1 Tax=uncultured Polaribacter sp. TaxID=174711 RepID=UPI00262EDEBF|nr:hypothetical protein [uncultured Polaribacter sp.]
MNAAQFLKNLFEGKSATSIGEAWKEAKKKVRSNKEKLTTKQQTRKSQKTL